MDNEVKEGQNETGPAAVNETGRNVEVEAPPTKEGIIVVTWQNVGSAPKLKRTRREYLATTTFHELIRTLRNAIKPEAGKGVHIYIHSFSPSPDTTLGNVINCFSPGETQITLHYSVDHAFG
uniref:Ubiquitin-like protein ATG12 n=1 Tax=Rhabditophanes sp. KR3021 TaxID=114890 RepID=A0AC35U1A9_9BILA